MSTGRRRSWRSWRGRQRANKRLHCGKGRAYGLGNFHSLMPSKSSHSRRQFLRTGTSALAATGLAGSLVSRARAADETALKVALIGCGGRGTGAAAQALSTKGPVKLWAMADAFEERLQVSLQGLQRGLTARYDRESSEGLEEKVDVPKERQFVGLDAYRKAIDSGVDVVILAQPPGFRPYHFDYAIKAGKHVFMEKPVATDAPGIRMVLAAAAEAKRKNLKVGVGLQRRHQDAYLETIGRIHDGAIGEVESMRCYWNGAGSAKVPTSREGMSEYEYQIRNWYYFTWLSGDHICEQHIHNIDVCNWIKQGHPVEAQGQGGRQVRTGKEYGNIFDHHMVEFTYEDGATMISQCRHIPGCWNRVAEFARGEKGRVELGNRFIITRKNGENWRYRGQGGTNPYQAEHDALFDAIRNDKPFNEAEQGAISTMTAILGRMATYSGKVIRWDQAINSKIQLTTSAEEWGAKPPILPDENGWYPVAVPGVTPVV